MNGYTAVAEMDAEQRGNPGGAGAHERYGTVHAAKLDDAGLPEHVTLCGHSTDDLHLVQGDIPTDESATWYPPGDHVRHVCSACDKEAQHA